MQGLVFEPSGYFNDKLKKRDKKNPNIHTSTPNKTNPPHCHHRSNSSPAPDISPLNKSCSALLDSSPIYKQPPSLQPSLSMSPRDKRKHHGHSDNHHQHNHHTNGRKRSASHKKHTHHSTNTPVADLPKDHILEAYKRRLKRKKLNRSRSMNSNGIATLLNIEKQRITTDKCSRLFYDFESTKSTIDKSERDQLFRSKLAKLNEKKQKNKAFAYELIRQYFTSILDKKYSNHPLALLITKFCNLFHGKYSFCPQDFKNKSIYQIVDQKRMKRKGNKRSTTDIFGDSVNNMKNQSKVVRKTSRRLDKATEDVKNFVNKLRALMLTLYPELKALRTYKYVVQSVFHKELFGQLTPTLGDLYSIRTEDKQSSFAKHMGMWQNLSCKDFGASEAFIEFCLVPSLRPCLLSEVGEHKETEGGLTTEAVVTQSESKDGGHEVHLNAIPVVSTDSPLNLADVDEEWDEKQTELIRNAEEIDNILTEQNLKEFDQNYAISQLLNDNNTLNNNANFTRPEYVNEYNCELDEDNESFIDIVSSGGSSQRGSNNTYDNSLPYSSHNTSELSYPPQTKINTQNRTILPQLNDEISVNKTKPISKSRISSIFSALSRKKKRNNERSNSADSKPTKSDSRKTPQQFLKTNFNKTNMNKPAMMTSPTKTPKISVTPQNEHQENHPTPPGKRVNVKSKAIKMQFKDNINNITKQMLAGSHAGKIANQLHNNRKVSIHTVDICEVTNVSEEMVEDEEYFETDEDKQCNPYLSAVLEIKKMPSYDTPEDKIQCVVRTADILRDCIDKYYENRRRDPVQITPDELLSLFAYILTQANLHCLWAEVDLIDDFVVDNLRMDMPGYYIATLRAAMQLIVNDIEKLTQKSTIKRNSVSNCI